MDPNHPLHGAPSKGSSYPSQPPRTTPQSQYPAPYGHSVSSGGGTPGQWGYDASSTPQVSNAPSHVQGVIHQTGTASRGAPQPLPSAAPTANSNYYGSTHEGWEMQQRQHEQQNYHHQQQQQQQQQQWYQQQWQQQQQLEQQQRQQQQQQQQQQWQQQQQQRQQLEQQRQQPHYYQQTTTMGSQALVPPGNSTWGNVAGESLSVGSSSVVYQPKGPPNPPAGGRVRCPRCGTTYASGHACPSCGYR